MSDATFAGPRRFQIHENDAGTEAYCDMYVRHLEAEIERLRTQLERGKAHAQERIALVEENKRLHRLLDQYRIQALVDKED